jgi:hypothetical protein
MDEQATPAEPVTTTPDPVVADTPTAEPLPTETTPPQAEPVPAPETAQAEPANDPIQTPPQTPTPQMEGNEALPESVPEPTPSTTALAEAPRIETPTLTQGSTSQSEPTPPPVQSTPAFPTPAPAQIVTPPPNILKLLFKKAQLTIQLRKQKKLLKVMTLFAKKKSITNDDVEKLLHVSDATATRYLGQLTKENKITQIGKTGHAVSYTKR